MDPVDSERQREGACKLQSNRTPVRAQMQASSSAAAEGVPHVYYFDTNNEFQELGNERKRVVKDEGVPMKRVRRVVDRWVYGPNPKYQLEAGESELVTKAVWVSVPMW